MHRSISIPPSEFIGDIDCCTWRCLDCRIALPVSSSNSTSTDAGKGFRIMDLTVNGEVQKDCLLAFLKVIKTVVNRPVARDRPGNITMNGTGILALANTTMLRERLISLEGKRGRESSPKQEIQPTT